MANTPAMESIFANAQQNAASLIETATLAINAKVNTIEEAENMIQELSSEAVMFNQLLTTIMNAMRQVESGDMQKEEAAGIIVPAVKELKDKCTALKIAKADVPGDDITEDEIAILRELIIGAKAAAEDRLVAIRLGDDTKADPEVEAELNEVEEGFIASFIERRQTAKLNKDKINHLWDSFRDKKAEVILAQFAKAVKPLCDGQDKNRVKTMVDDMIKADERTKRDFTNKLSAKDYIVKSFDGIHMAIMPGDIDGFGCNHILAPVSDNEYYFFKKEICNIILNPVNKTEVGPAQEAYEAEIAMEAGFLAAKYVHTNETKTAKALYSNAKKLWTLGEKTKAIEYMKKAKALYQKTLNDVLNSGKFEKVETTTTVYHGTIRRANTRTNSLTFAIARDSLEKKIDRCTAHILQWTTKAGKETYQQTLDQLKADREQAKAAKKAAKATENFDYMEGNVMEIFDIAYESNIDTCLLEEMDYEAATEGANIEAHKLKKSYSKEIRTLAKQAKKAYKLGKYSESKNCYNKCADLCNEMISEIQHMDQTNFQVQLGNILHMVKTIGSCLLIGGLITGVMQDQKDIQTKLDTLNAAGRGELTKADLNKYTRDIISKMKMRADKFKKLADKAAKGELNSVGATESFDEFTYDSFMFACESYMDELMTAMEAEEGENADSEAPSAKAGKIRSVFSKLKGAVRRGDKKAVEEAKAEADAAVKDLADAEAAAPDEKKEGYKKAAKTAAVAIGAVAAAIGLTAAGTALYQKAKGKDVDPMALYKMAGSVTSGAVKNVIENQKNAAASRAVGREEMDAEKLKERNQRANQYFIDQTEKHRAKALKAEEKEFAKYNKAKAKAAAKAAKEAFGISEFDAYEVILEAMNAEVPSIETYESDEDLANAIETMI